METNETLIQLTFPVEYSHHPFSTKPWVVDLLQPNTGTSQIVQPICFHLLVQFWKMVSLENKINKHKVNFLDWLQDAGAEFFTLWKCLTAVTYLEQLIERMMTLWYQLNSGPYICSCLHQLIQHYLSLSCHHQLYEHVMWLHNFCLHENLPMVHHPVQSGTNKKYEKNFNIYLLTAKFYEYMVEIVDTFRFSSVLFWCCCWCTLFYVLWLFASSTYFHSNGFRVGFIAFLQNSE